MLLQMWMRIYGQNQPSDVESIEIRVSLMFNYGFRMRLATYAASRLVCIVNVIKESGHKKLLSTKATFDFCLLC